MPYPLFFPFILLAGGLLIALLELTFAGDPKTAGQVVVVSFVGGFGLFVVEAVVHFVIKWW